MLRICKTGGASGLLALVFSTFLFVSPGMAQFGWLSGSDLEQDVRSQMRVLSSQLNAAEQALKGLNFTKRPSSALMVRLESLGQNDTSSVAQRFRSIQTSLEALEENDPDTSERLTADWDAINQAYVRLSAQQDRISNKLVQAETLESDLLALQSALADREAANAALQQANAALETQAKKAKIAIEAQSAQNNELARLRGMLAAAKEEATQAKQTEATSRKQITALSRDLEQSKSENRQMSATMEALRSDLGAQTQLAKIALEQVQVFKQGPAALVIENKQAFAEQQAALIAKHEIELAAAFAQKESLKADLLRRADVVTDKLAATHQRITMLEQEKAALTVQVSSAKSRLAAFETPEKTVAVAASKAPYWQKRFLFKSGRSRLTKGQRLELAQSLAALPEAGCLSIYGSTDDVPVRANGKLASNADLARRRVQRAAADLLKIAPNRLGTLLLVHSDQGVLQGLEASKQRSVSLSWAPTGCGLVGTV